MKRPLLALPPESLRAGGPSPVPKAGGFGDVGDAREARTDPSIDAPTNVKWPRKPTFDTSTRGNAEADPRSARPEVAVRVSVIDSADRLVYVDTRDRRGWKQPLAAEQVASKFRKHRAATDGASSPVPRTVRTLERPLVAPQRGAGTVPNTPTPYSVGKAGVPAGLSLVAAHQRVSQRPVGPTPAKPSSSSRAR